MGDGNLKLHGAARSRWAVIARIVAYNHPLMFRRHAPSPPRSPLGNTVVVKAPDQAPLSLLRLAELIGGHLPARRTSSIFLTGRPGLRRRR